MDLIPIGHAAERLGLKPSALRYYDRAQAGVRVRTISGHRRLGVQLLPVEGGKAAGIFAVVGFLTRACVSSPQRITVSSASGLVELQGLPGEARAPRDARGDHVCRPRS